MKQRPVTLTIELMTALPVSVLREASIRCSHGPYSYHITKLGGPDPAPEVDGEDKP